MSYLDSHDITAIGMGFMTAFVGSVSWLWNHSVRLARAEEALRGLARSVDELRDAHNDSWREIRAALMRIEDKLDRKADR